MKQLKLIILFLSFLTIATAQERAKLTITVPAGPKPWTTLDLNNDPRNFQFAIVTDRTGGHRPGVFLDGIRKLNLLQPEFVMSVGDLIEGYTRDLTQLEREWTEFEGFIDELTVPFFYVPGNHDITNEVQDSVWEARFGLRNYFFKHHDVLFLCLNSEDRYQGAGRGTISDEQYEWVKETLAANADVRWTLVFMHQPIWNQPEQARWPDVEQLLADRKHTVFVGHHHRYVQYERNNANYYILATTGGSSPLRGPQLGEFDHVVWVTMTDAGPILANLQLEGIWSADLVTEQTKEYIVNVSRKNAFKIEPIYVDGDAFAGGSVQIKITNDENVPLTVRFTEGFSWDLLGGVEMPEIEVAPNSVEMTTLFLNTRRQRAVSELSPFKLTATLSYQQENGVDLEIPFTYQIKPEPKYYLNAATTAKNVDGAMDDWQELPYTITGTDAADLQARFGLQYDDDYLYVGIAVQDDDIHTMAGTAAWNQDMAGVVINADPLAASAMNTGGGWYEESAMVLMTPATTDVPSTVMPEEVVEGMLKACKPTADGYFLEVALPISYIQERQGDNWQTIRFNIRIVDVDTGEEKEEIWFQPEWRSKEHSIGSGMFFKAKMSDTQGGGKK